MIGSRALTAATVGLLAAAPQAPAKPPSRTPARGLTAPATQVRLVETVRSQGARFVRYDQEVGGVPVLGAGAVLTDAPGRRADLLLDHTLRWIATPPAPRLTRDEALARARAASGTGVLRTSAQARLAILPKGGGGRLVWQALLAGRPPVGSLDVLVDARSGAVVRVRDARVPATGAARIFDPNPITAQGFRGGLADNNDADSPALTALRAPVTLERLDGSTCLFGQWVHATLPALSAPPLGEACAQGSDFTAVTRSDLRFEAVMAYFHIDRAQAYLQSLGFTNVNNRRVRVHANGTPENNSFYDLIAREITFGTGGVDDAEDADSIVHEYGHAVQHDQFPAFSPDGQTGAIGEGFADYFAAAQAATFAPHHGEFDACMSEWDATADPGVPACVRRLDTGLTVSQAASCAGEIHCVGQVWGGALWTIRQRLGGANADRLIVQSHFSYPPGVGFADASRALLAADRLLHGGANRDTIAGVLVERGLVDPERLDDTPDEGTPLPVPGSARGRVDAASDPRDYFRLSLPVARGVLVRLTAASGELDLRLLRPGARAANEPGAVVAGSTDAGAAESFAYVPQAAGDYALEVSTRSGAGDYLVEVLSDADGDGHADAADDCANAPNFGQEDRDRDGLGDACDNCPRASNADQANWDRDRAGDACDRSARATLERVAVRGSRLTAYGRALPASLPLSAWRVVIERRVCKRSICRYRRVKEVAAGRREGDRRVAISGRPRAGRYRVRAVVRAPRFDAVRSRALGVTIGR